MAAKAFITPAANHPRPLDVLGEKITVLASGEATGGYELFLQEGKAGQGPPPHMHDWDETFYVLNGEIEIGAGEASRLCRVGDVAHAPAGTTHWFHFVTDGKMVSVTSRAGASAFFASLDREAPGQPAGPEGLAPIVAIATRHGLSLAGPPPG